MTTALFNLHDSARADSAADQKIDAALEKTGVVKTLNIMAAYELVRGWPKCWERYSRTSRKRTDTLAEAIDNVVAEMPKCGNATIEISIGGDWVSGVLDLATAWLRIRDNATGMQLERLEQCLAMGELSCPTSTSLHEHGMGMKTMLIMICKSADSLRYIATKTADEPHGYRFAYCDHKDPSRPFGQIPVEYDCATFGPKEHGTEFYIEGLTESGVYSRRQDYSTHVVEQLGFKYSRALAGENVEGNKLTIKLRLCNRDGTLLDEKTSWDIKPIRPVYRDFGRPVIDQRLIRGAASEVDGLPWQLHLDFGLAAQENEYIGAGHEPPSPRHPCHQFNRKIAVVMHGKVIATLGIDAFSGNAQSNMWVPYTGTITLISGFSTTHEKNGIWDDGNWQAARAKIYEIIQPLIASWANKHDKDALTEKQISDEYARRLAIRAPGASTNPSAEREYPVGGAGGYIDILYFTDKAEKQGLVIELKAEEADGLDAFQTLYYMFMCDAANKTNGRLVARSFSTGAHMTVKKIQQEMGVNIELRTLEDEALDTILPKI
jgi:hypothetical protein